MLESRSCMLERREETQPVRAEWVEESIARSRIFFYVVLSVDHLFRGVEFVVDGTVLGG